MHASASDWIAILGIVLGGGGGGTIIVKLTRLVVAVEGLLKTAESTIAEVKGLTTTVASHETRLTVHDVAIGVLQGQQAAKP